MTQRKILVVFGITGNQGGSVAKVILNDPKTAEQYEIRGITRDATKPAALALIEKGVTLVNANMDDKNSLRAALKDAYAVFAMTDWGATFNQAGETQQGKNIAEVAKELNVQHLIWSTLPDAPTISKGKISGIVNYESKVEVEKYIKELGIPSTTIQPGVFTNFLLWIIVPASKETPKTYKIYMPWSSTTQFPLLSVQEDNGKYIKAILNNREKLLGKTVLAAVKYYSMDETIKILRENGGLDISFEEVDDATYRAQLAAQGIPDFFVESMSQNMKFGKEYGYFNRLPVEPDQKLLDEPLETLEEWVEKSPEIAALRGGENLLSETYVKAEAITAGKA